MTSPTQQPPSVDALARSLIGTGLPQPLLVDAAHAALAANRPEDALQIAQDRRDGLLRGVINATGVLLHTNLGRAPYAVSTDAMYVNLEFDLASGERGSRRTHAGPLLARACGAESALIVNNGAAALLLVLAALARGRDVAVSRGELVEIGGGFRLPDVMAESGAQLVEVGTTNRTRRDDYARAGDDLALILKVHASNFRIVGFTEAASVAELATLGPDLVVDLGSGLLDTACPWLPDGPPPWLANEPAVRQTLADGAALTIFSGDKLLGGPQAGVIAGRADLIASCAAHPLYRAMRPGALVLAAMQDVALSYLARGAAQLPFWTMATTSTEALRTRAKAIAQPPAPGVVVTACTSIAGGGSAPGMTIPSWGLKVEGDHAAGLRAAKPRPVIARVQDGDTVLDLRTVDPEADRDVRAALDVIASAGDHERS